jgi:myo-inositol-1(or 4)-monophosphatase
VPPAPEDSRDLAEIALEAALEGGRVVRGTAATGAPEVKGRGDYVTAVDLASEGAIVRLLSERVPGMPVVGEEAGGETAEAYWLVDPLDGTANFVHGLPIVGVSVAAIRRGSPAAGAVHAPFFGEAWVAAAGHGARHVKPGGERLEMRVGERPAERAIVGTGFPFRRRENVPRYLRAFARCYDRFEDLRRPGAAALDLAWTAAGVYDGFFELGLGPWDVAAGAILIREAGGLVTDWTGDERAWLRSGDVLAGPPAIHEALLEIGRQTSGET